VAELVIASVSSATLNISDCPFQRFGKVSHLLRHAPTMGCCTLGCGLSSHAGGFLFEQ